MRQRCAKSKEDLWDGMGRDGRWTFLKFVSGFTLRGHVLCMGMNER